MKMDNVKQEETTCQGCRDGILNQLGHMDEGGCLYIDYEEYTSEISSDFSKT